MPVPVVVAAAKKVGAKTARRAASHTWVWVSAAVVLVGAIALPFLVFFVIVAGVQNPSQAATQAGIPPGPAAAYIQAADRIGTVVPGCQLRWQVLAGIGLVESNHAAGHQVDQAGEVTPPILGPRLDGSNGTAAIADTDGGRLDGDSSWDRAVGPMQFIPSSWAIYGTDGNSDGTADPANFFDAALSAGVHLCRSAGGGDLNDDGPLQAALFAYNHSDRYVATVLAHIHDYDKAGIAPPVAAGPAGAPSGQLGTVAAFPSGTITVDSSIVGNLQAMVNAAHSDGVDLAGGGFRDPNQQIALRAAHCGGTDHFSVFERPASQCSPPTAIPGTSMHEKGLAIDFTCNGGPTIPNHSSPCFTWLQTHAASFDFFNLASEPWHWSTTGA